MSSTPPQSSQPDATPEPQAPTPAAKPPLRSSKVSRTDKTAPAAKTDPKPAAKLEPKAKTAAKSSGAASGAVSGVVALSPRSSHNLKSDAAPGLANRPIDPSPIQISRSVSLAGIRPIGISVNPQPIVLTPTSMVLNRPIADNSTDDDDTLMGYLD
jgi:hypothetical protein